MSKDYCHYEVLEPVMGMPTSEDGLLLSIRHAREDGYGHGLPLTRERRILSWEGERKAGLLMGRETAFSCSGWNN